MRRQKHILVYHVGSIGDTIVALPAFRTLRSHFPDSKITLVNLSVRHDPAHATLYEHTELFDRKHILLPPRSLPGQLLLRLKFLRFSLFGRYSALYCFSPDLPRVLVRCFRFFQRAPVRHSFLLPEMRAMPLHQAYLECLKSDGMEVPPEAFDFSPTPMEKAAAAQLHARIAPDPALPLIAFGIGSGKQCAKWPLEHYAALISILRFRMNFIPFYPGGEGERKDAEQLIARCGGVFAGDTDCRSLRRTIAFLRHCNCYIGNDTGAAHLAAASGIPCAVICSAHDLPPEKWHPFGECNLFLRSDPSCAGCGCRTCPKGDPAPCLAQISAEEAAGRIQKWLEEKVNIRKQGVLVL